MHKTSAFHQHTHTVAVSQNQACIKRGNRPMVELRTNQAPLPWKSKVLDVCLVAVWGLSIPGLMWLAAAGGF